MDFRQLQYITTVAEYRNITKAADALFISQSALSHYIQKAEQELGIVLFDRSTTPISLTLAGQHYVETARRILLENEQLMKVFRDITHHMTGKLRIGTSRDRASYTIPRLLPAFAGQYPGIEVEVVTESGYQLTEALRAGKIDLVLLPVYKSETFQGIETQKIYSEELIFAAKAGTISPEQRISGHPGCIDLKKCKDIPFFLLFQEHRSRYAINALFRSHRIKPPVRMEFASNITCYWMASTGMGVTIVPYLTTRLTSCEQEIELLSLDTEPVTWDVEVWTRKNAYLGQPERDLIELARGMFRREML